MTQTGIGGVGNTPLALRAAAGLRKASPDGVGLVQLAQPPSRHIRSRAVFQQE